jgi:hypothetical protein
MPHPNSRPWFLCVALAVILSALTFTPLVIPAGQFQPELSGVPYTLWVSILLTILLVLLTYIGTRVHPGRNSDEPQ